VRVDIGNPSPAGTATYSQNQFFLSGAGTDIYGVSDQFQFVYQPMNGDAEILARVDAFTPADSGSKVGVMIRSDLSAGAANAFVLLSGANGLAFQFRSQPGATTAATSGSRTGLPTWLRLTRAGATVTGYSSSDGVAWTVIGSASIALSNGAYIGLAVTSHVRGTAARATLSQVKATSLALPTGQQAIDIGAPSIAGSSSYRNGVYTITAAGADIGGTSDQFRFVYQQASGDLNIVARVSSLERIRSWTKAGVMVRETLAANSRHAMALMSGTRGYSFQWRLDAGGVVDNMLGGSGATPGWVRLVRTGQTFEAFSSGDGVTWTSIGRQAVAMANTVYVGLAVTSQTTSRTATATFDGVKITQAGAAPNRPPTVTLTAPAGGSSYTAPANMVVSASASDPEKRMARVEFYANTTRIGSMSMAPYTMTWSGVPTGTYSMTAVAYDLDGARATSAAATISVNTATSTSTSSSAPRYVVFQESADQLTFVTSYRLDVFANGTAVNTAAPVASSNLGKPAPDQTTNNITVDRATFFAALAPGTYLATVSAIGSGGESRSQAITFTR
jgi:regulation of enolase protein 1 (concanavalin A-like superfamily)